VRSLPGIKLSAELNARCQLGGITMIPANGFRSARPADIAGGNLVALQWDGGLRYGIAIASLSAPHTQPAPAPQRGILLLQSDQGGPLAISPTGYCLDLGKPVFQWERADNSISNSTQRIPPRGHLIAHTDGLLITGVGVRHMQQTGCAWKVVDGMMSDVVLEAAIYLSNWSVGLRTGDGHFEALFAFNPAPRP
jgi:hypothetical protein